MNHRGYPYSHHHRSPMIERVCSAGIASVAKLDELHTCSETMHTTSLAVCGEHQIHIVSSTVFPQTRRCLAVTSDRLIAISSHSESLQLPERTQADEIDLLSAARITLIRRIFGHDPLRRKSESSQPTGTRDAMVWRRPGSGRTASQGSVPAQTFAVKSCLPSRPL